MEPGGRLLGDEVTSDPEASVVRCGHIDKNMRERCGNVKACD
jgi:hypothetical protein